MKKLLLCIAVLALMVGLASSATITGRVVSAEDDQPLARATVTIIETGQNVPTDEEGYFHLDNADGTVTVTVSHVGYASHPEVTLENGKANLIKLQRSLTVLDSYVVTANRYEKEAYKVSQPITAVSSDGIATKGHMIVSDVIRTFPGLDMNDAGPFRARPVIRGLYGTRVLVLVDGERLNDQRDISSFAGVSLSLVDVNEIKRVEVVNGPSSVLYGSDAMGGVINIITNKNSFSEKLTPVAKYSGRYSTADDQHSNRLDVGVQSERLSASAGFQYREANNDFQPGDGWNEESEFGVFRSEFYDSLNAATGRDFSNDKLVNSQARINNFDANASYKINDKHRLDFDFGAFRASDIGYPGVPNDSTPFWFFYPNHDRDNVSLKWSARNLTDRMARLEMKVYYEKISKEFLTDFLNSLVIPAGPGMFITPMTSLNRTEVEKYGLNFQELYTLNEKSQMTFGADFLREEIDGEVTSITRFEGFGPFPYNDTTVGSAVPKNSWNCLGLYVSGETEFDKVLINTGLRFDNFWINTEETDGYVDDDENPLPTEDEHYASVNGSLGAVYPLGSGVNLVTNIGTAYRVPNVVERFYFGSASNRETRPNPDIKPEKSVSLDFGVKAVHDEVNYSLIGFYSDYSDFTQLQNFDSIPAPGPPGAYTPLWRYENIDDVTIYGFEGVVEANFHSGIYGSLSFTYQHGQNDTEDEPLFVSPVKTTLTAGYRHKKHGLFGELTVRKIEDQDRVPNVTYLDDIATKGFTVVNMTAGVTLFKSVRMAVTGKNLFDEVYAEPFNARNPDNPVPEAGRGLVVSINAGI